MLGDRVATSTGASPDAFGSANGVPRQPEAEA